VIKYLQDLWILKEYGLIIFSKIKHHNIDDQCLGGLTSALYSFAQTGLHETLLRFTTNKFEYKILEKFGLLFVATFPSKTKEKVALCELNYIAEKCFEKYSEKKITNWDYNVCKFSDFTQELITHRELVEERTEIIGNKIEQLWDHSQNKIQIKDEGVHILC
jgi:hypothetical protein